MRKGKAKFRFFFAIAGAGLGLYFAYKSIQLTIEDHKNKAELEELKNPGKQNDTEIGKLTSIVEKSPTLIEKQDVLVSVGNLQIEQLKKLANSSGEQLALLKQEYNEKKQIEVKNTLQTWTI